MIEPARRFADERDVWSFAAPDTLDLIRERVANLLSHGRRITMVDNYLIAERTPTVRAGMHHHGGIETWGSLTGGTRQAGFTVRLYGEPDPDMAVQRGWSESFSVSACVTEDATEADAIRRYRAAEKEGRPRRNFTRVNITGGCGADCPARDDLLEIVHWNDHGVGREWVIAFDHTEITLAWRAKQALDA